MNSLKDFKKTLDDFEADLKDLSSMSQFSKKIRGLTDLQKELADELSKVEKDLATHIKKLDSLDLNKAISNLEGQKRNIEKSINLAEESKKSVNNLNSVITKNTSSLNSLFKRQEDVERTLSETGSKLKDTDSSIKGLNDKYSLVKESIKIVNESILSTQTKLENEIKAINLKLETEVNKISKSNLFSKLLLGFNTILLLATLALVVFNMFHPN